MISKRIKKFALFSTVFALYGCTGAGGVDATIASGTAKFTTNAIDNIAMDMKGLTMEDAIRKTAFLGSDPNNTSVNAVVLTRDVYGVMKTKRDVEALSQQIQTQANEEYQKRQIAKQQEEETKRLEEEAANAVGAFRARVTTYGIDCYGCNVVDGRGGTSAGVILEPSIGVHLPDGSVQSGIKYGQYYIVAADPSIPLCSTVKVSNHGLTGSGISPDEPFYAIVLDRGGAIHGEVLDLYAGLESAPSVTPVETLKANVEIMRIGNKQGGSCPLQ